MKNLLLMALLLFASLSCWADTAFADSLFAHQEYYRAITEYYRSMFAGDKPQYCHAQIRDSYLAGADYEGLIDYLRTYRSPEDQLYISLAHLKNNRPDLAAIINDTDKQTTNQLLWAYSNSYLGRFGEAELRLQSIDDPAYYQQIEQLQKLNQEAMNLNYRNPVLAGALGLIPGLGYAYIGEWQTALSALVTNALIAAVSYELATKELYLASSAVGFVGITFYLGSIYGSANQAAKRNVRLRRNYLDQYTDQLFQELLNKH